MIVFIQHIAIEGPAQLGMFFLQSGYDIDVVRLYENDCLPQDLQKVEAVIILGGPMNVYEQEKYPFLKTEHVFLKEVIKGNIPLLGICLGAQLLAFACGAQITKAQEKEIGWYKANLTDKGSQDALFQGVNQKLDVFQWHEDTFEIPNEGVLLATSGICKNQAFRCGRNAYGLQFHIEVTDEDIRAWAKEYQDKNTLQSASKEKQMIDGFYYFEEEYRKQADIICRNFSGIIKSHSLRV